MQQALARHAIHRSARTRVARSAAILRAAEVRLGVDSGFERMSRTAEPPASTARRDSSRPAAAAPASTAAPLGVRGLARAPFARRLGERPRTALTVALLVGVMLVALAFRLPNLAVPNDNYDEGVYLQSLFLMRHGYRPFADIVATQGPLHLHLAYVPYALGGYSLSAARAGSVVASLVGLLGVAWAGHALGGRVGAIGAALALGLGPTYLAVSRQALPEAPAIAIAALSVGAAAQAHRGGLDRWRLLAGALLGLACLVKPVVAPAAIPVLLLASGGPGWRQRGRATLLAPAAAAAVGVAGLALVGAGDAVAQVFGWRLGGQQLDPSPSVVWHNADLLVDKMFRQERPAFWALALVGGLALLLGARGGERGNQRRYEPSGTQRGTGGCAHGPCVGLAVVGWAGAQLAVLLAYVDLGSHLGATLVAPLAVLGGLGLAAAARVFSDRRGWWISIPALLVAVWYATSVPALLERDRRLVAGELSTDRDGGRDERAAVRAIARLTDADDWVLTDAPYLAFLADRKVPPALVDPSNARIRAGALTGEQVVAGLRDHDPALVVLWTGKLARLESLMDAIAVEYESVEDFGTVDKGLPRAIYRARDDD